MSHLPRSSLASGFLNGIAHFCYAVILRKYANSVFIVTVKARQRNSSYKRRSSRRPKGTISTMDSSSQAYTSRYAWLMRDNKTHLHMYRTRQPCLEGETRPIPGGLSCDCTVLNKEGFTNVLYFRCLSFPDSANETEQAPRSR